jgi:hypothetical protein
MTRLLARILLALSTAVPVYAASARVLGPQTYHLGSGMAEWAEFEGATPHGPQLDLVFTADAPGTEGTLLIHQRDVKVTWNVMLNGQRIGRLESLAQPLVLALAVPAGAIKPGENRLSIVRAPSRVIDDIVVGPITLDPRPRQELLGEAMLEVRVSDAADNTALPSRITLTDIGNALVPFEPEAGQPLAVRTGVVYTGDGRARLGVAPGHYVVYASRGFEYSVATERISVGRGEIKSLALQIRREVPTPGLVACDTHIHTLTYSKHGDATLDERMYTIAGEGIEVAVATDHNHHADYSAAAARAGLAEHFTSVVGNEVTTKVGHFNAFPIAPGSELPDANLTDWPKLLQNIRARTGAKVIVLNHPRDVHSNFTPLGPEHFNATTGTLRSGPIFECDAIEVVTSAAMQSDVMLLYRDWFALLNHGHRVAAVGSSDTHHVSQYILGQSRTYAVSGATRAGGIDIDEVAESFRSGRLFVSMGLLTQMTVNNRFVVGDLATGLGGTIDVAVTVTGPSWTSADRVELYANGMKIREQAIAPSQRIEKARVVWQVPGPRHDVHLVAIATGPGVLGPFWEIAPPYQPASKVFTPRVIGSTNPIWIDGDGDRRFTAARTYAAAHVAAAAGIPARLIRELASRDEAIATQAADLWAKAGHDLGSAALRDALRRAPAHVQSGFAAVAGSAQAAPGEPSAASSGGN